jgi:hypothetical protein
METYFRLKVVLSSRCVCSVLERQHGQVQYVCRSWEAMEGFDLERSLDKRPLAYSATSKYASIFTKVRMVVQRSYQEVGCNGVIGHVLNKR